MRSWKKLELTDALYPSCLASYSMYQQVNAPDPVAVLERCSDLVHQRQDCAATPFDDLAQQLFVVAAREDSRGALLRRQDDVLSALKIFLASETDTAVAPAAFTVGALSDDVSFRKYLTVKEHQMLQLYIKAFRKTSSGGIRSCLMTLLVNLSYAPDLKPLMLSDEVGFRDLLIQQLDTTDESMLGMILTICSQLSYSSDGSEWLLSDLPSLYSFRERLLDLAFEGDAAAYLQAKACALVAQLVYRANGSDWLLSSERGALQAVAKLLESYNTSCVVSSWQLLANMAHSPENRTLIFYSPILDILQKSISCIRGSNERVKENAIRLLWGVAVEKDITRSIVSGGQMLLPLLLRMAQEETGKVRYWICRFLVQLSSYGDDATTEELLVHGAHVVVLNLIQLAGFDVSLKEEKKDNYVLHCLSFIMNMANHDIAIPVLKASDPNPVHVMTSILQHQSSGAAQSLKAMFTIAFLIGREEHTLTLSDILVSRPDMIHNMVEVLEVTLQGRHGHDYRFGTFNLQLIIHACLAVSVSEKNKARLAETPVIGLLKTVLDMFVNNEDPIPAPKDSILSCGGGRSDSLSAALAIETLLQLSFTYEENEALQEHLMPPGNGLLNTVKELVEDDHLPDVNSRRSASLLLSRLLPQRGITPVPPSPEITAAAGRTHVMLSYSWHHEARPRLVVAVEKELRKRGCDVWRDETGSSLWPPMHGSTQDCMARAVELSSVIVVFVSKQYKESPNCRCECKYANQLRGRKKLDIVFVMMQKEYTTSSQPNYCDGWLGLLIGDSYWLSLFDDQSVTSTASEIFSRVNQAGRFKSYSDRKYSGAPEQQDTQNIVETTAAGLLKNGLTCDRGSVVNVTNMATDNSSVNNLGEIGGAPATETTPTGTEDIDETFVFGSTVAPFELNESFGTLSKFDAAYQILKFQDYAVYYEELLNFMFIVGVLSPEDLAVLSTTDVILLSKYLKRAPRLRFLMLMEKVDMTA